MGTAYLLYLGVVMIRKAPVPKTQIAALAVPRVSGRKILLQGFLTNALNPKVALFFLAFVPQFIERQFTHKTLAFLYLGVLFNINGTIWTLIVAWSTARFGARLTGQKSLGV